MGDADTERKPDNDYRIAVDLRGLPEGSTDATRVLLAADVLRRFLDVVEHRPPLLAVLVRDGAAVPVDAPGLQMRDPDTWVRSPADAAAALGGAPTIVLARAGRPQADLQELAEHRLLLIEAVTPPTPARGTIADVLSEHDPTALRLALLRFPFQRPAVLSAARLRRAEETLQRWRFKVAMWADMPAAPLLPDVTATAYQAVRTSLDIAAVLRELHRLEVAPHVASGCKFATFADLDGVLGLDLCHLVGKLRR